MSKQSDKLNAARLLVAFGQKIRAGKWQKKKNLCIHRCVWLKHDGEKGVCFWKECVYDKPAEEKETQKLP